VVFRWPLDFSMAVRRALGRMRPSAVVLMEGEVWPNFLAACRRRGIAAVVVNGRISADKGYPRYRMLGPLARRLFNALTAVGAQDERYAGCYRKLGVEPAKVHVTGMIKFDSAQVASHIDGQEALAAAIGLSPGERLLVAGGTGPGEEDVLLEIYRRLKVNHPSLRLAVVPRKPERFDEVARKLSQDGGNVVRRSQCPDGSTAAAEPGAVVVGDTMGELRKFYALAEVVFVGRSLAPMGGSDMIESAALGKPTCFGPHTFNFPQAKELAARGCRQVCDAAELERVLDEWLGDPAGAARQGAAAQEFVRSQQGSCRRNVEMICGVLGRQPSVPGAIATPKPD
jgi:3-deoxy-D-manno-octulosonic-acid transferase